MNNLIIIVSGLLLVVTKGIQLQFLLGPSLIWKSAPKNVEGKEKIERIDQRNSEGRDTSWDWAGHLWYSHSTNISKK